MLPEIKIFNRTFTSYAIMAAIGLAVCILVLIKLCKIRKEDDTNYVVICLISIIGLLIGSHLLYGITHFNDIIEFFKHFNQLDLKLKFQVLSVIFGGSVFYGGLIGLLLTGFFASKKIKVNRLLLADMAAQVIPLFHFFGRIGCFLVGCCYGIESKIGFIYTHSANPIADGVRRLPIQLIEAGFNLTLFFILNYMYRNKKCENKLLCLYLIIYPIGRFLFEFFRGDQIRGFLFGLSTSQIISIMLLIFSVCCLIKTRKKK